MTTLTLRGDHITLAQALKVSDLADTGGQAKHIIRAGEVKVNGVVALQPAKKLVAGDVFERAGKPPCTVVAGGAAE